MRSVVGLVGGDDSTWERFGKWHIANTTKETAEGKRRGGRRRSGVRTTGSLQDSFRDGVERGLGMLWVG